MNVLLIYPDYPETFWGFSHALKFVNKKAAEPPLGLLTVAALLPKEWAVKLVQLKITPIKDKDLQWADMVFVSAMSIQRESARRIIDRCKNKGVKVVAGGPLFTTSYEGFEDVDHLVLNEAEITLPPFLEDLKNGQPKHIYTSAQFPDISESPVPRWELINMKKYANMGLQYSRGCPYNCDFCNISTLYGNRVRTKSKNQVIGELNRLYTLGWRGGIFIVDDNFIGNKRKLKNDVLPGIIQWMKSKNYPFTFKTEASIDLADDEQLMTMMVKAGFDAVFIGIETPNEASLAECNKVQNTKRDLLASVKKIQRFGMQVDAGFIVGFDNDRPSTFEKLSAFIHDSGIVTAMVGILNAPNGSKLFKRLQKENRIVEDTRGNNTDLTTNFIPKMGMEKLVEGYKKIIAGIYSPGEYYKRVGQFIKDFMPKRKGSFPLTFSNVKAFLKSILFIGIFGAERKHYWKLLVETITKYPAKFPMAIKFAIYGFHFRKIFQDCFVPLPAG